MSVESSTIGDEWGGIFFDWYSSGSALTDADVGYAPTPISLFYQDAEVANVRVHHFKDRGIWIYESASGERVWVHDCEVFRDESGTPTLDNSYGQNGIVVEKCRRGRIESNTVSLVGAAQQFALGAGIWILNGKTWCSQTTQSADSLLVIGNALVGPGGDQSPNLNGTWSGIRGDYPCGGGGRVVEILENIAVDWNWAGLDLWQGIDVQVSCNRVQDCRHAVEFSRNESQGDAVRFLENDLEILDVPASNDQRVVRTDNALFAQFGPSGNRGFNNFVTAGTDEFFFENDAASTITLNAVNNYWERNGVSHVVSDSILAHCTTEISDPVRLDPSSAESAPNECAPSASEVRRNHGIELPLASRPESRDQSVPAVEQLPARTGLAEPEPQPSRKQVRLRLDLAGPERRSVRLDVYDVSGRRVRCLVAASLTGGRYSLTWQGEDERGEYVAAGVYFVRLAAGDVREVRKVVWLK